MKNIKKLTPLKAIRKYCLFCMNDQASLITKCDSRKCLFFHYRMGRNKSNPRISALKQIKKFCKYCCDNSTKELQNCPYENCSLHIFRFGKNPFRSGKGNKNPVFVKKV